MTYADNAGKYPRHFYSQTSRHFHCSDVTPFLLLWRHVIFTALASPRFHCSDVTPFSLLWRHAVFTALTSRHLYCSDVTTFSLLWRQPWNVQLTPQKKTTKQKRPSTPPPPPPHTHTHTQKPTTTHNNNNLSLFFGMRQIHRKNKLETRIPSAIRFIASICFKTIPLSCGWKLSLYV